MIAWAEQQYFRGRRLPENSAQYRVFSREYYWSPAYRFFDNPYYGRSQWEDMSDYGNSEQVVGKIMVTTESHRWESGADYREQPSYFAPREYMYKKMELQYSNNIGEWLDKGGQVVCFDPSITHDTSSCLLVKKDFLIKFLNENKLKIFWVCQGEKHILGGHIGSGSFEYNKWLEMSGVFTLKNNSMDGTIKPLVKSIKS